MCPEHDRTLLWLYGEAPDEHASHVAGCAHCRAVVAEHEGVASALGPALGALGRAPPARARGLGPWVAPALLAAAALVAVIAWPDLLVPGSRPGMSVAPGSQALDTDVVQVAVPRPDPLETAIEDLDRDLSELELELL